MTSWSPKTKINYYRERERESVNLKNELLEIAHQIRGLAGKDFSWKKIKELLEEAKEKVRSSSEEISKEIERQEANIFFEALEMASCFSELEVRAEVPASDDDLNFLQEIAENAPKMIDWAEKESPAQTEEEKKGYLEAKERAEKLKKAVQEEKQRRKQGNQSSSSSDTSSNSSRSPSPTSSESSQTSDSSSKSRNEKQLQNEINSLKQTITELQAQIAELKQNQNKDNADNPEITKKIETLENQKQQTQSELNKKQSQVNQAKDKSKTNPVKSNQQTDNNQQSNNKDNGFKWWYVAIPAGVLLVVMGIVIAYLMGKNKEKK
ncbi:hypothetical protein [endosymbiont GvMRE of Glomus versiforme]|uniref:hypothetical protein n=1 Tax=endosymbiont GvMRE of Glomus versiforme TaxID=2039283 RepID=UPI0011C398A4|nr:hypothetical protein [endosymbiont GvMRE of Glomus versiforme]